jgi:hypothetical protein
MAALQTKTLALLDEAEKSNAKPAEIVRIVREARENELALARLTGLLREGSTTINDNRRQTVVFDNMDLQELLALRQSLSAIRETPPRPHHCMPRPAGGTLRAW